jgi:hypothetical protein
LQALIRVPDTEFEIRALDVLPRVNIAHTDTGSDGTAVRAFIEAGAQGIVAAGFVWILRPWRCTVPECDVWTPQLADMGNGATIPLILRPEATCDTLTLEVLAELSGDFNFMEKGDVQVWPGDESFLPRLWQTDCVLP